MLNIDGLSDVLEVANQAGIHIDYVETNSSWFIDEDSAIGILKKLRNRGLNTLLISISPFHTERIPFYKVKGVLTACRKAGISIFPWIEEFYYEIDRLDDHKTHSLEEFTELFGEDYLKNIPLRYWIHFGGRALKTYAKYLPLKPLEEILISNDRCIELTDTSHFHIDLFGNYIPGLCSGLAIHTEDLHDELNKETYPVINLLYEKGIKGFHDMAVSDYSFKHNDSYLSKCHLCFDIRRYLVLQKGIKSSELEPVDFYSQV